MDEVRTGFKSRLAAGEVLLGSMVTLPSPAVAEILVQLGYQWLFVDGEHGPLETAEVLAILQAVGDQVPCIVRVPAAAEVPIKKMLDLGAAGIIAPQVNTAQQAADVVAWSLYAPEGRRGVGLARAHGYGLNFQEYVESANQEITVIVQAEHAEAVENIEQIVQVEGIDAVLLGPYDLAASLGKMGQVDDPEVTGAIDRITAACQEAGLPLGIFGVSADAIRPYIQKGYNLVVAGTDTIFLASAGGQMLGDLQ
ncbi:MAG: aldolase/citrate lyase family protein [Planctomycetota bacterium]|nr:aldolase/citrate lyase family protein [Planctomycetota bacterium]